MKIIPQCHDCKHYQGRMTCTAFSQKIPREIIVYGLHDHIEPFPGDKGIRFEPVEEKR